MVEPLTLKKLRSLLHYAPKTGVFTWRKNRGGGACKGDTAGGIDSRGYVQLRVNGSNKILAHRLAWFYMTGAWPKHHIDHIDGVRTNNAFSNLRDVPRAINNQNRSIASRSSRTGVLGVWPQGNRFVAAISIKGVQKYLGCFATVGDAEQAYKTAKKSLHPGCLQ
jgi:HNH endonuclease